MKIFTPKAMILLALISIGIVSIGLVRPAKPEIHASTRSDLKEWTIEGTVIFPRTGNFMFFGERFRILEASAPFRLVLKNDGGPMSEEKYRETAIQMAQQATWQWNLNLPALAGGIGAAFAGLSFTW